MRLFVLAAQYYLAAQCYKATTTGLYRGARDDGFEAELAYWLPRPDAAAAWNEFAKQAGVFPAGFDQWVQSTSTRAE